VDFTELSNNMLLDEQTTITNSLRSDFQIKLESIGGFRVQNDEKSPLFVKHDGNVGISTNSPSALLDIKSIMHVKSEGNVGIGSSSPAQKLDVSGKIQTDDAFAKNGSAGLDTTIAKADVDTLIIQGGIITKIK